MAQKRSLIPEENPESPENQQRNQRIRSTISTCLSTRRLLKGGLVEENSALIEQTFRNMVRPVIESLLTRQSISRSLANEAGPSTFRKFKLQFEDQLPDKLYTGNSIEVKIVLLDALSGEVVMYGSLSSAKVELVVLEGHFEVEMPEDWAQKYFDDNIVSARADKSDQLLFGECVIALCNGIGFVKGISFTDNSSWVRSKKFRLGAKIKSKMAEKDEVREAVSSAFRVKHRRGEAYQKDSAPTLEHEVWHLKGISRDGRIHKRLKDHQICKVKDLLQQYHKDQSSLRMTLGSSKTCKLIAQQIKTFFPSNDYGLQTNCMPSLTPPNAILASATVPSFAAAASQDQQEFQMPCTHRTETTHGVDDSLELNPDTVVWNDLMVDLLATSCGAGQNWGPDCNVNLPPSLPVDPLHGQETFNFPTSVFLNIPESTVEVGNGSCLGATRTSPMGIFSSMPNLGASTSQRAKPKRRFWSKIRAVCRMLLINCGAATLKKGKFPLIS